MGKYYKKLTAYYSSTDNTKFLVEQVARAIGADLLELTPKKKMNVSVSDVDCANGNVPAIQSKYTMESRSGRRGIVHFV